MSNKIRAQMTNFHNGKSPGQIVHLEPEEFKKLKQAGIAVAAENDTQEAPKGTHTTKSE